VAAEPDPVIKILKLNRIAQPKEVSSPAAPAKGSTRPLLEGYPTLPPSKANVRNANKAQQMNDRL